MQNQQDLDAQAARLKLAEHGGQGLVPGSAAYMADIDARHAELLAQQLGVPDDQAQRRALREQRRELKRQKRAAKKDQLDRKKDEFRQTLDQHAQSLQTAEYGNHGQGGALDVMHDKLLR